MHNTDTVLIVNPASAGGRTWRRLGAIRSALQHGDVGVELRLTTRPREATELTRDALRAGFRRVVAVGGDGTLNEIVNGYFDDHGEVIASDAILGIIPSGTGGDFRHTIGIDGVAQAVAALARESLRRIDVGRIDVAAHDGSRAWHHHFINIADWGVGGEVVARVNRNRFKAGGARGTAVFLATSLNQLLRYRPRAVEISLDGESMRRDIASVVVANGQYFGGGMRVAPRAAPDDGLFDVIVTGPMPSWRKVASISQVYRGRHLGTPGIEMFRARTVDVIPIGAGPPLRFEAEGEELGAGAATITCLPGAIPFVVGP